MELFSYSRATGIAQAATAASAPTARFIAGGTTLLDLMKLDVERPTDINRIGLDQVEKLPDGRLKIGALVRNSDLAHHPLVQANYAVLSQALLAGASAQLRNMATTGGNLLQRSRCMYFRNTAMPCNKRTPGEGCSAIEGDNRTLAILGTSKDCIATNPSDMNVALTALEAVITIQPATGPARDIPIAGFFLLPGTTPHIETVPVSPTPVAAPRLIKLNEQLARDLNLDPTALATQEGIEILAGNRIAPGSEPLAIAYAGHQFGHFVPQLGDGRANLLGEVLARNGQRYDIQLKGSGPTPFSRRGDGRAALKPGDLITHVTLPAARPGSRQLYLKLRDRASYEFALASAAIVAETTAGKLTYIRVALGGVGTRPWRSHEAEAALLHREPTGELFQRAAVAALRDARPQSENAFKIELAKRCLTHALTSATQLA